ncbi:MAG: Hsp20/alpha crystallin family protein [Bacteroidales bacterium]|nr:Hsp20/alpha crystallin family protein [Bacteroidales bacterium]MBP5724275.1 Hsp20/alpha crystallin family protein [Bacteroidales bacterium]MBR4497330.1 Hsp20/alpha crystallin family protein [Bacteroidales bacterium]MBR7035600.1 Hsp20/alpha crystallin family protein [Bacteroidales bacterium]
MLPLIRNSRRNQNANAWVPSFFEDVFNDDFWGASISKQFATPAVNIKESDKDYTIQIAAPGMTKNDFKININEYNELAIYLEKKDEKEDKGKEKESWLRREFSYTSYSQSFAIPEDVDETKISAKIENGVLNIDLPKKEVTDKAPVTRQIEIQ